MQHAAEIGAAIDRSLFDKQTAFDSDRARRKAAFCTRRAGKTDYVPKKLVKRAVAIPESIRVFLAITRQRARELIWRPLEILNERYSLGADLNGTTATVTFPNHACIRLRGADDAREAGKGRGDKLHGVDIDEAQTFAPEILKDMIDNVYGPALEDVGGDLCVYGTPGVICAGEWFEMTQPDKSKRRQGWSVHSWSVLDNPFMAHMKQRLPELMRERGWTADNPTFRREWLGEWVNDTSALFYAGFEADRNLHDRPESELIGPGWMHTLGWDLGLRDDMALVAWAFHPNERDVYEAYSWKKNGVMAEDVVRKVEQLEERGYNFLGKVADTGGLGALVVEEVGKRLKMHFDAAKKTEKGAHVELFNDDLRTGRAKVRRDSPYARELATLPKDPDEAPTKWPVEHPGFPNHCCDAGLYAWRAALHFLHKPREAPPPRPGTPEWHVQWLAHQQKELEQMMEQDIAEARERRREEQELADLLGGP